MVTVLAWTEQVKCRWLSEQPNYNRVAAKPCNMKLVIGITLISVNHYSRIKKNFYFFFAIYSPGGHPGHVILTI